MRKYFITGLVILLPLALTFAILSFIIDLFTAPFVGFVSEVVDHLSLLQNGVLFLSPEQLKRYVSQFFILAILFALTVGLGVLTRWVVVHYFLRLGDYVFHRIPIVRSIYKTSQDVIRTLFTTDTSSFRQVVLVPFPNEEARSMGFVTRDKIKRPDGKEDQIAVFMPTTPNPTSGFLIIFDKKDVTFLDMKVEEGFKYIISCGVVQTNLALQAEKES